MAAWTTRGRALFSASSSCGSVTCGLGWTLTATWTCNGPALSVSSVTARPSAVRTTVPDPGPALICAWTTPARIVAAGVAARLIQALASPIPTRTSATSQRRRVVRRAARAVITRVGTVERLSAEEAGVPVCGRSSTAGPERNKRNRTDQPVEALTSWGQEARLVADGGGLEEPLLDVNLSGRSHDSRA